MNARLRHVLGTQTGVAMVTVLLVGASLTVLASTGAFMTVKEFQAGTDDRKAAEALAIAEAGVDRFVELIRGGSLTWGEIRLAGCDADHPPLGISGSVGKGTFTAEFQAFNHVTQEFPPAACIGSEDNPRSDSPRTAQWFAITSKGEQPAATRSIRQVVQVGVLGLPIGIYAEKFDANGSSDFDAISFISPGDVQGREKMSFEGLDPYYTLEDFWPSMDSTPVPAGLHTLGTAFLKKANQNSREHPPSPNCGANGPQGAAGQTLWDQTGSGADITAGCAQYAGYDDGPPAGSFPPTSLITSLENVVPQPDLSDQDYLTLRATAKREGLYCLIKTTGERQCTRMGGSWTPSGNGNTVQVNQTDLNVPVGSPAIPNNLLAYFEFEDAAAAESGNQVNWRATVSPCSDVPADNRSVVVIVRGGSYDGDSGAYVNGFVLAPDGEVELRGSHTVHGTIIAKSVDVQGTAQFELSSCWVRNMPGPFLDVTPERWSEVDR
jgi:hypothetical protein